MLTKILLTAAVIIGALLFLRHQSRPPPQKSSAQKIAAEAERLRSRNWMTAIALVVLLALGGIAFYVNWADNNRTVAVRVVNTTNGSVTTYEAFAERMEKRRFVTVDGRVIEVADTERVEISEQ
jgi:hypothetical protein